MLALSTVALASLAVAPLEVLFEMTHVEYTNTCGRNATDPLSFNITHNIVTGIKYWAGEYYVSVPRWRQGVPSTLNKLVPTPGNPKHAKLQPWPDCAWQEVGNPFALQYVQSMEIDTQGRMWIIDAGRRNFWAPAGADVDNSTHPKIIVLDIASGATLRSYTFESDVAPYDSSFLNDIVVDEVNMVAHISNANNPGGIITYDYGNNVARALIGSSTSTPGLEVSILGTKYSTNTSSDGIALSPDLETVYYCPLSSYDLYAVPAAALRDIRASQTQAEYNAAVQPKVRKVGTRPSNSDGLTMSDKGTLYLGGLTTSALYEWANPVTATSGGAPFTCDHDAAPSSACPLKVLNQSDTLLNWIDTFAWDDTGGLIFTSNRLQLFFDSTYNFTTGAPANFRILRLNVSAGSYLQGEVNSNGDGGYFTSGPTHGQRVGLAIGVLIFFCLCGVAYFKPCGKCSRWRAAHFARLS